MNAVLLLAQGGPISVRCTSLLLLGAIEAPYLVGELAARTSLRGDVKAPVLPRIHVFRNRLAVPARLSSTEFYSTLNPTHSLRMRHDQRVR